MLVMLVERHEHLFLLLQAKRDPVHAYVHSMRGSFIYLVLFFYIIFYIIFYINIYLPTYHVLLRLF